jgi:hypothetical protein
VAFLDQRLLKAVAFKTRKTVKYTREQVSRRGSREGVASEAALIMWARDLGIGVSSAARRLPPHVQQQLTVARVGPHQGGTITATQSKTALSKRVTKSPGSKASRATSSVFISHSSKDEKLAEALIALLRGALNIPAAKILCTSVPGHRLKGGANTEATLKAEVLGCKVLIGLVTPESKLSAYVMFELGARWGVGKALIALTARGISAGDVRQPLSASHVLNCRVKTDVYQLVGDVGTELGMDCERPEVFEKFAKAVVRAAK